MSILKSIRISRTGDLKECPETVSETGTQRWVWFHMNEHGVPEAGLGTEADRLMPRTCLDPFCLDNVLPFEFNSSVASLMSRDSVPRCFWLAERKYLGPLGLPKYLKKSFPSKNFLE